MTLPREHDVNSRDDLADFVEDLAKEYEERGQTWENRSLGSFLEALSRCLTDHREDRTPGTAEGAPVPADWGYFAFVLGAATVYE